MSNQIIYSNNLKIITVPNPLLRQKSAPVKVFDKNLREFCQKLANLISNPPKTADVEFAGISAPQVGILAQIFVAKIANKIKSFVNPEILTHSEEKVDFIEGCLSIPNFYGHVVRPAEIDLKFQNPKGLNFTNHYTGLPARIIQHEVDHLAGILFIDHVHSQSGKLYKVIGKDEKGEIKLAEVVVV